MLKNIIVFVVTYVAVLHLVNTANLRTSKGYQDQNCECVPYDRCKSNFIANEIADSEAACPNESEICCKVTDQIEEDQKSTFIYEKRGQSCGYTFARRPSRVWQYAYSTEFPWSISLSSVENPGDNTSKDIYKCGGTLIHPQVVLTAAHCVSDQQEKYRIHAGVLDIEGNYSRQDRNVKRIVLHDKYEDRSYDIAILFLESPVIPAGHVDVVCLPQQGAVVSVGTRCLATGWGKVTPGPNGKYATRLQKVEIPIVDGGVCQNKLRTTSLGEDFVLDNNLFCAGGEPQKGTCEGDDGGPILCPIETENGFERYELTGIIGKDVTCAQNEIPAPYLNVAAFKKWIDEHMVKENLDPFPHNEYE